MGDSRRFQLFAQAVKRNFPPREYCKVADIAGGKGHLQLALREAGYEDVTTFDLRPRRAKGVTYKNFLFTPETKGSFDLLIAMHPDEATDVTIYAAARMNIPFIICPCCIKPTLLPKEAISKRQWIHQLRMYAVKNGFSCETLTLPMQGDNVVIVGRRKGKK